MTLHTRLAAAVLVPIYLCSLSAQALTLKDVFDGVNSNATSSGAFQGQTMNVYSGGSLFMRVPRKTYNLASATAPSMSMGCGGIDLTAGAFSHVNKDAFVAMLRNIGQNALGYSFKLAIQNLCAPCDNVMQALEETARFMNSMNINSCEAAQGVVNAALADLKKKSDVNLARTFGPAMNKYDDAMMAWTKVFKDDTQRATDLVDAKSNIPGAADQIPSGNVVWKALKKLPGLDDDVRELFMSMIGTVIFSDDPNVPPIPKDPSLRDITALLGTPGVANTSVPTLTCTDGRTDDACRVLTVTNVSQRGLHDMVMSKLRLISDHISQRSGYGAGEAQELAKFVNVTDIPIYKILATTSSLNNSGIANNMMNNYGELIAARYAEAYFEEAAHQIRTALDKQAAVGDAAQAAAIKTLRDSLNATIRDIKQTVSLAYARTNTSIDISVAAAAYERQVNASLPRSLRNSLAFQRSAGGF